MADPTGREAFEKWARSSIKAIQPYFVNIATKDGEYENLLVKSSWLAFQAGRNSMKTESVRAIEAEADRLEKLDKGPAVLVRKFAARFRALK